MMLPVMLLAALVLAATETAGSAVETSQGSGGSVYMSTGSATGDKYYGQWTIGDLTCYIAKDKADGEVQVVKQCRNGLLGIFHDMTEAEQAIVEAEVKRTEEEKKAFNAKIAQSKAVMQNTMRSMNSQLQRNLQGMHNYMNQMQQMMQQQMQHAFGING